MGLACDTAGAEMAVDGTAATAGRSTWATDTVCPGESRMTPTAAMTVSTNTPANTTARMSSAALDCSGLRCLMAGLRSVWLPTPAPCKTELEQEVSYLPIFVYASAVAASRKSFRHIARPALLVKTSL